MEINAISSLAASFIPHSKGADNAAERVSQVSRDSDEIARKQSGTQKNTLETATRVRAAATLREAREEQEIQAAQASNINSGPHIQFKDAEGTRVMEVYDSKNILIYQVPPKGLLMLIQNQENQPDPQVETSA